MKKESGFQRELIREIESRYPGCVVMKNDANYRQGFPDLLILYENKWALLETKRFSGVSHRPNQDYWVNRANTMSYAAFIFPENRDEILEELDGVFERNT